MSAYIYQNVISALYLACQIVKRFAYVFQGSLTVPCFTRSKTGNWCVALFGGNSCHSVNGLLYDGPFLRQVFIVVPATNGDDVVVYVVAAGAFAGTWWWRRWWRRRRRWWRRGWWWRRRRRHIHEKNEVVLNFTVLESSTSIPATHVSEQSFINLSSRQQHPHPYWRGTHSLVPPGEWWSDYCFGGTRGNIHFQVNHHPLYSIGTSAPVSALVKID